MTYGRKSSFATYTWDVLPEWEYRLLVGIDMLGLLVNNLEESYKRSESILKEQIDAGLKDLEEHYHGSYIGIFETEIIATKELIRWQRYSVFLSAYAYFEGRLKDICNQIQNIFGFTTTIEILQSKEGDFGKCGKFLTKIFGITESALGSVRTPVSRLKMVRNIIAHQDGIPTETQAVELQRWFGKKWLFAKEIKPENEDSNCLKKYEVIYLEVQILNHLISSMQVYFEKLLPEIDSRYQILNRNGH